MMKNIDNPEKIAEMAQQMGGAKSRRNAKYAKSIDECVIRR